MAAAYGSRLSVLLFASAALRGAVRTEPAGPALTAALLTAAAGYLLGCVVGGACGRLAAEQAARDVAAEIE